MENPLTINPNRLDIDEAYMQMAEVWARRSKANRLQVGAILVRDRQIISDGYNGMPTGSKDELCETIDWMPSDFVTIGNETVEGIYPYFGKRFVGPQPDTWGQHKLFRYRLLTKRDVLHAESNALLKISRNGGLGATGATMYVTVSPCFDCAKLLIQSQVARVVYRHEYRDTSGIEELRKYGIKVDHLPFLKT